MPIKFLCEHCGAKLQVASRKAGSEQNCPRCERVIVIPSAQDAEAMLAMQTSDRYTGGQTSDGDDGFLEFAVADDEELIYDTDPDADLPGTKYARLDPNRISVPRLAFYVQGALLGVVACVFFVFGVMVGKYTTQNDGRGTAMALRCRVLGIVQYRDNGRPTADEGAMVIVVPKETRPNPRPDVVGLRIGVEVTPDNPDQQLIREIGGAVTKVSESGQFEITVSAPREYYLLIISRNSRRPGSQRLTKEQRAEMGGYFLPVENLVQDRKFEWRKLALSGSSEELEPITF